MQPEQLIQPAAPAPPPMPPTGHYDFILNPEKPDKPRNLGLHGIGGNPFIVKIAFIIVSALLLMGALGLAVNLLFGSKTNLTDIVGIVQEEQEIARLSGQNGQADDQLVKNAAVNTLVTASSEQQIWLRFLQQHGRVLKPAELDLKKDATADQKLTLAKQSSTFDSAYTEVMRAKLVAYTTSAKTIYGRSTNKTERALLARQYADTQLLLKQWPK